MSKITSQNARLSKVLGALLGVHSGDSLGATLEFMSYSNVKRAYPNGLHEIVGGGSFDWPVGHATDDTDLTRAVLLAYQDRAKFSKSHDGKSEHFDVRKASADYSVKWLIGDWPDRRLGTGPADIGFATTVGLQKYQETNDVKNSGAGMGKAGNGSLMRCIPTGLFAQSRKERVEDSMAISAITHNDPRCIVSCAAYNEIVAALVEGKDAREAVEEGREVASRLDCPAVGEAMRKGMELDLVKLAAKGDKADELTTGFVLHGLALAVAAVLDTRSLEEVLVDVVRLGGDTDTNGAIAGGLLGARDGIEGIPERWLSKLQFREEFERIARELVQS